MRGYKATVAEGYEEAVEALLAYLKQPSRRGCVCCTPQTIPIRGQSQERQI